jgi:hypothetical protein
MRESASAVVELRGQVCIVAVLWLMRFGPERLAGGQNPPETTGNHRETTKRLLSRKSLQIGLIKVRIITD